MNRTYKRKLILTKAQESRIKSWIGVSRLVYNMGLSIKIDAYKKTGKSVHKYELMKQLSPLRKEYAWINDAPIGCLETSIERLDCAYNNFFRGGGFPKFTSKRKCKSLKFKKVLSIGERHIKVPKIGKLKIFKDSEILGTPKQATIKIEPTGFFICIYCTDIPEKFESENQAIGLDMGISKFCVDSNGSVIDNPRHFAKYERRLRIENRSLARKNKGSNQWQNQVKKLALLYHKIGNVRKDFLHKESTKIAKSNNVVYMENLNVAGMSKNRDLSKHILDCGWSTFRTMIAYKTTVVAINPAYTSQTCFVCGCIDKKSRISQSEFVCTSCGNIDNADVNAAKNIKRQGMSLSRQREAIACA